MFEKIGWTILIGCTGLVVYDAASRDHVITSIAHQCSRSRPDPGTLKSCADQEIAKLIKRDIGWSIHPVTGELLGPK